MGGSPYPYIMTYATKIFHHQNIYDCGLFVKVTKIILKNILLHTLYSMPRLLPVLSRSCWSTSAIYLFISIFW